MLDLLILGVCYILDKREQDARIGQLEKARQPVSWGPCRFDRSHGPTGPNGKCWCGSRNTSPDWGR